MPRNKSSLESAAGKLVSAISKEWGAEAGLPTSSATEVVMHAAHSLLDAAKNGSLVSVVGSSTVVSFLGEQWVADHPNIWEQLRALEEQTHAAPGA